MALENKLGIKDSMELARLEEKISKKQAVLLYETDYLKDCEPGSFQMLSAIHRSLFGELYDFAGKVRTVNLVVDWSMVDKDDYLLAMERSPIKDIEIKYLLKQALTDKINDREVYMKGIDHSYYYEGYVIYRAEDL